MSNLGTALGDEAQRPDGITPYRVIGKSVTRRDAVEKVSGRAHYTADYDLPGTLWKKALHAPYAHARIISIDTSAACNLPGVHSVVTATEIEAGPYGRAIKDIPVLAGDRVRFFGERIAAVAADDEDIAQHAVDLIEVEYEELSAARRSDRQCSLQCGRRTHS